MQWVSVCTSSILPFGSEEFLILVIIEKLISQTPIIYLLLHFLIQLFYIFSCTRNLYCFIFAKISPCTSHSRNVKRLANRGCGVHIYVHTEQRSFKGTQLDSVSSSFPLNNRCLSANKNRLSDILLCDIWCKISCSINLYFSFYMTNLDQA